MKRFCISLLALSFLLGGVLGCGEADKPKTSRPLADGDGDGVANKLLGGRDCDDNNPKIPGGLEEKRGNKIDDNCNGQIDEIWAKKGYWRLTTPEQSKSYWDINVTTFERLALQHVSCLQFAFSLKSTKDGRLFNITQWQTGLPYNSITFINNKFEWKLDDPKRTLKIIFKGTLTSPTTMSGTISVRDTDPKVNAGQSLPFTGRLVTKLSNDSAEKDFCRRCYGDPTCTNR